MSLPSESSAKSHPGQSNHWKVLGLFLWSRTHGPLKHPTFLMAFVFGVIGFAPLGVWYVVGSQWIGGTWNVPEIYRSVATFFAALGLASACDLILPVAYPKSVRALSILATILIVTFSFLCLVLSEKSKGWLSIVAALGVASALATWWIANAENETFKDFQIQNVAIGGSVDKELSGDMGDFQS